MKYTLALVLAIATASTSAAHWPQFHGPKRDNKSPDKEAGLEITEVELIPPVEDRSP